MTALTEFIDTLPRDSIFVVVVFRKNTIGSSAAEVDSEIPQNIENLPRALQLAASFVRTLEEFNRAKRAES
jgi:hypothetical protein